MDGVKFVVEGHGVTHFNIPNMTMHHQQSYGNQYPVYQHHSHPLGFYGSKYESSVIEEATTIVSPAAPLAETKETMSPTLSSASPGPPRKMMRNKYSREQKNALERSFLTDGAYVSVRQREVMAEELGLSSKQVKVWYQNRRQKDKRRNQKLKQQQQQQQQPVQDHVTVIKVPPSAGSPDSGVQDILDDSRELMRSKERQMIYHEQLPVANKVEDHRKSPVIQGQVVEAAEEQEEKNFYDSTTTQQIYSLAAAAHYSTATAASATTGSPAASAYPGYPVQFDYSQAFANYYDYRGAYHQYYQQLMSGYQSQAQQLYSATGDPQEAQTYSGY